jgi:ATP-dependent Lon protease
MGRYDETRAEYESLVEKNPANPIYPAALALGLSAEPQQTKNKWFETVARLAPDWVWSHYARGQLLQEKEPERALEEYLKIIEKEATFAQAYNQAISIQERRLKRIDDAIMMAEKMASQSDLRLAARVNLWRLRLAKVGATEEPKTKLRTELQQLALSSNDVNELASVRTAYNDLLKDKEAARVIAEKILRIDPSWYPERGLTGTTLVLADTGPLTRPLAKFGIFLKSANKCH